MTSSGIKALIRKFNLCLWATACGRLRLTCCAEWEWQENNPCLCACPVIKARRGASETLPLLPLPLLWLPSGHPWPSHRHPGSKMRASNPFFLPLCVRNCLCALCVRVSADLPVKTRFVSWAQLYTCFPRLISWSLPWAFSLKRPFVSVYTSVQVCTPLFVCLSATVCVSWVYKGKCFTEMKRHICSSLISQISRASHVAPLYCFLQSNQ